MVSLTTRKKRAATNGAQAENLLAGELQNTRASLEYRVRHLDRHGRAEKSNNAQVRLSSWTLKASFQCFVSTLLSRARARFRTTNGPWEFSFPACREGNYVLAFACT